jgi:Fur family transcriptional regulator, ferric uptake regulator
MSSSPNAPDAHWHSAAQHTGVQKDMFLAFLASKHLKLTRQRQAVVDEIFSDSGHFEAEELVERLKNSRTRVSRATVYRTLELLRECQLVEKLDFGTPRSFYEHVPPGEHHDHLICTRCGNVIEFHNERLEALQREICSNFGFQDSHHSLRIFGLCSKCAQAGG